MSAGSVLVPACPATMPARQARLTQPRMKPKGNRYLPFQNRR
ncbi:UNVERIFIED_ORG: hypothetical protein ABIC54_001896 [Burkholderia sp. 1263]